MIVVGASAGSGKTYALTREYCERIALLCSGESPLTPEAALGAALAVTFTNKAALELRFRVLKTLKQSALGLPSSADPAILGRAPATALLNALFSRSEKLGAGTLDSLGQRILGLSAAELGLVPGFAPEFDRNRVVDLLLERTAERAEGDPDLEALLTDVFRVERLFGAKPPLLSLSSFRKRLSTVFELLLKSGEPVHPAPPAMLEALDAGERKRLADAARRLLARIQTRSLGAKKDFINYLDKLTRVESNRKWDPAVSAFAKRNDPADCFTKAGQKQLSTEDLDDFSRFAAIRNETLPPIARLRSAAEFTAFSSLGVVLLEELARFEEESGALLHDKSPVLGAGLAASGTVPRAHRVLAQGLKHCYIDEFQDTAPDQWRAIKPLAAEALSNGGALYVVGDVKQAIYGFRGGDAALFDELPVDPDLVDPADGVESRSHPFNWRSAPAIVAFNNAIFQALADPESRAREMAEALIADTVREALPESVDRLAAALSKAYAKAEQGVKAPETPCGYVQVECIAPASGSSGSESDESAGGVGDEDQGLADDEPTPLERLGALLDSVLARRPPRDVAVLCRSVAQTAKVEELCRERGIPALGTEGGGLAGHPVVGRVLALFRALLDRDNDAALFAAASSGGPLNDCLGLDDARLSSLAAGRSGESLFAALERVLSEQGPPEAALILSDLAQTARNETAYGLLATFHDRLALRRRFPAAIPQLDRLLETALTAQSAGLLDPAAFLAWFDAHGGGEKVPLPDAVNAVRIMTIHKAKGLEFPVVILANAVFSTKIVPPPRIDPLIQDESGVRLSLIHRPKLAEAAVFDAVGVPHYREHVNLLYTALTRPREELYVLIQAADHNKAGTQAAKLLFKPLHDFDGPDSPSSGGPSSGAIFRMGEIQSSPPPRPENEPKDETPTGPVPVDYAARLALFREAAESDSLAARARGEFAHRTLDLLAGRPLPEDEATLAPIIDQAVRTTLFGPSDPHDPAGFYDQADSLHPDLVRIILRALRRPEIRTALAAGSPETALLTSDGVEKRPDLIADLPQTVRILEYKTGPEKPEHAVQLTGYLELASRLPGASKPLEGLLVYLDLDLVKPVPAPEARP